MGHLGLKLGDKQNFLNLMSKIKQNHFEFQICRYWKSIVKRCSNGLAFHSIEVPHIQCNQFYVFHNME